MKRIITLLITVFSLAVFTTCEKFEVKPVTRVETGTATPISTSHVSVTGKIIDLSGEGNDDHGFCYATHANPTVDDGKISKGKPTIGDITGSIEGLALKTLVFVRAYCLDEAGVVYGIVTSTTTLDGQSALTTTAATDITATSAVSGGNITIDGGAPVTARGVVWNSSQNPTVTINQGITSNGTGTGSYTSNITGLTLGITYYVRAYATNSFGTSYGNQVSFTTSPPDGPGSTLTDVDNNFYNTVWINGQLWMKENLKTTKYNNGTAIPLETENAIWTGLTTPAYCWYGNDQVNYGNTFGALYNWYTVNTGILCPAGWHVPTDAEWTTLTDYVGGVTDAGTKLKATSGWSSDGNGIDSYGFCALPGGTRNYNGNFGNVGSYGYWWSSTERNTTNAWRRFMTNNNGRVYRYDYGKEVGISVRCVRN